MNVHDLATTLATKDHDLAIRVLIDGTTVDITGITMTIDPDKPEAAYALTIDDTNPTEE